MGFGKDMVNKTKYDVRHTFGKRRSWIRGGGHTITPGSVAGAVLTQVGTELAFRGGEKIGGFVWDSMKTFGKFLGARSGVSRWSRKRVEEPANVNDSSMNDISRAADAMDRAADSIKDNEKIEREILQHLQRLSETMEKLAQEQAKKATHGPEETKAEVHHMEEHKVTTKKS